MKAYYETVQNGLIPVEIVGIVTSGIHTTLVAKVTRSQFRNGFTVYRAGELLEVSPLHIVSRKTRVRSGHIMVTPIPVADIRAALNA